MRAYYERMRMVLYCGVLISWLVVAPREAREVGVTALMRAYYERMRRLLYCGGLTSRW
jgi:hypothetical protein